ncbi:twin-arginine translocase TatA/TatE family subunit [Pedobacter sp. AJM]|nr:twin-arginine translocase TatA/TatE family subunit [Pedobacter sp. AJM]OWK70811.1 twin-arginine translocase TatA/TatE family subunit [Pedobacter sp. AJM]
MSTIEIILIGVIILLLFGGKKLPELMRGIGRSMKAFKNAKDEPAHK